MKRVSFEVAKALKEAGYPQYFEGFEDYGYFMNGSHPQIYNHDENDCPMYYHILCIAPTYLEVWLWLWREKKISIDVEHLHGIFWGVFTFGQFVLTDEGDPEHPDPEEAIIAAIDYLVKNDLIK